jgi:hypothetical protein
MSCNNSPLEPVTKNQDTAAKAPDDKSNYRSLKYIDSFIAVHDSDINKNNVLHQKIEALATKQLLPLIDKQGLYDDLPFEFVTSDQHEGKTYGNFVYKDDTHFVKVQTIIKPEQINNLLEGKKYSIRFKTYRFEEGVSIDKTSGIDLPTVNAYLISATPL